MHKEVKCQNIVFASFSFVLDEVGKKLEVREPTKLL